MGDISVLSINAKPIPKEIPKPDYKSHRPSSSYETKIINLTNKPICIANRLGLNQLVEPTSMHQAYVDYFRHVQYRNTIKPGVYITVLTESIAYRHGVIDANVLDRRYRLNDRTDPSFVQLSDNLETFNDMREKGVRSEVCYFISQEELDSFRSNHVYLDECDLYIATDVDNNLLPHLQSREGKPLQLDRIPFEEYTRRGAGMTLVNVDNSGRFGKLYYYMFGTVWCLHPVKDVTRPDGIYLFETGNHEQPLKQVGDGIFDPHVTNATHQEWLDGKMKIKVYRTESEAWLEEEKTKQRIDDLMHQKAQLEEKLKIQELALRQLEIKAEQEEVRHRQKLEESKLEAESTTRKHKQEQIRDDRRDISDFVKTAFTIVTTVLTGILGVLKIMEKVPR